MEVLTSGPDILLPRTIPGRGPRVIALATWGVTPLSLGPRVPLISAPGLSLSSPSGHPRTVNTPSAHFPTDSPDAIQSQDILQPWIFSAAQAALCATDWKLRNLKRLALLYWGHLSRWKVQDLWHINPRLSTGLMLPASRLALVINRTSIFSEPHHGL